MYVWEEMNPKYKCKLWSQLLQTSFTLHPGSAECRCARTQYYSIMYGKVLKEERTKMFLNLIEMGLDDFNTSEDSISADDGSIGSSR